MCTHTHTHTHIMTYKSVPATLLYNVIPVLKCYNNKNNNNNVMIMRSSKYVCVGIRYVKRVQVDKYVYIYI